MADLTMERYATVYINKPNPNTARPFWYDSEVADKEGCSVQRVAELRNFYQTEIARQGATPESVIARWNMMKSTPPPPAKGQASGQEPTLGSLRLSEAKAWFREVGLIK